MNVRCPMKRLPWLTGLLLLVLAAQAALAQSLTPATPEAVGMSAERLTRVHGASQAFVDRREIAGAVTLIARGGRLVDLHTVGWQEVEKKIAISPDTIFRIASMTKPVTSVAVLMLHEEGKFLLTDPVSRFIPAFKGARVLGAGGAAPAPARREITIRDLLTHRSGITYGFINPGPVGDAYRKGAVVDGLAAEPVTLAEAIDRLAAQPLVSHPGEAWNYGLSVDVLGRLVEVASGLSFDAFLRDRLFKPLRMPDTDFVVPEAKWARFATAYTPDPAAGVRPMKDPETFNLTTFSPWAGYRPGRRYMSGGAGLVSTARDYARFAQMLLNGGELDGARILSPKTVELMTASHTSDLPAGAVNIGGAGSAFGLGVRVLTDLGASQVLGSTGLYGWLGIYGTMFWIDPQEDLIGILMVNRYPGTADLQQLFQTMTYQAIVGPPGRSRDGTTRVSDARR